MKKIYILICILLCLSGLVFAQTNVVIGNVSVAPNPFSPNDDGQRDYTTVSYYLFLTENITNPNVDIIIYQGNQSNIVFNNNFTNVFHGLNEFHWDGLNNSGTIVNDGNYGLKIVLKNNTDIIENFVYTANIIVKTTYPIIEMISASPNPFSPNDDGYQDVHTIRTSIKNAEVYFLGLIEVSFSDTTATFVEGPHPIPHSDGAYLFLSRPSSKNSEINIPGNVSYELSVSGFNATVTAGNTLYKLGENYLRIYGGIGSGVGFSPAAVYGDKTDFIAVYAISSNLSFNIYNDDGTVLSLNDMYPNYFGSFVDNYLDHTNINASLGREYTINVGKNLPQIPGSALEDGRYIWRMIVSNEVETGIYSSGEFIVNNIPIQLTASAIPNEISPQNNDGFFDEAIIQYSPSEDAFVTVKIWSPNDESVIQPNETNSTLVKVLLQRQFNFAGYGNHTIWNGTDSNNNIVATDTSRVFIAEVTAVDKYVNDEIVSIHIPILVDNLSPASAILTQSFPDSVNVNTLTVSGRSNEVNSDILLFHKVNNNNYQPKGVVGRTPALPGRFEFNVELEEGVNQYYIRIRDSVYNLGTPSNTVSYYLDSQAPIIYNTFPIANTNFSSLPITFMAYLRDDGVGLDEVKFGFYFNNNQTPTWVDAVSDSAHYYYCVLNTNHPQFVNDPDQVMIGMLVRATDKLGNQVTTETPVTYNYFKPASIAPPRQISSYPSNNAKTNNIVNNTVNITLQSERPFISDSTSIVLSNGTDIYKNNYGAILNEINALENNIYVISLTLLTPLTSDGSDDSNYFINYIVTTDLGVKLSNTIPFVYDTTRPVISHYGINNMHNNLNFANEQFYFTSNIDSVSVYLSEDLSGINFASNMTRVTLYQGNQLINGTRSHDPVNRRITWRLNNSLSVQNNQGEYTVKLIARDLANNLLNAEQSFILINPVLPVVETHYPQNNSNLRQINNSRITKRVHNVNGFGLDRENSEIKVISPSNSYVYGDLSFEPLANNRYNVHYTFLSPLSTEGTADGIYTVRSVIVDTLGINQSISISDTLSFVYDTQAPVASSPKLGRINSEGESVLESLTDLSNYENPIEWVQIDFTDISSGVNFNNSFTYIKLYNYSSQNQLISGVSSVTGNTVKWTLNNPVAYNSFTSGRYFVLYQSTDNAGNVSAGRIDFRLINPSAPQITSTYPASEAILKNILNNKITVNFSSPVTVDINDFTDTYIRLITPENNTIMHNQGANQLITDLGDGQYKIDLSIYNSLPANGQYKIITNITNIQSVYSYEESFFIMDNIAPEISQLILGLSNGNEQIINLPLANMPEIYSGIEYIKAYLQDNISGVNYMSSTINIDNVNGTVIKYPEAGFIKYIFNNLLIGNNLQMPLEITALDMAENTITEAFVFTLKTLNVEYFQVTPAMESFVNNNLSQISAVFEYAEPVTINMQNTFITLKHPDGSTIQSGTGAILNISTTNNLVYELTLTLNQALAANGQDDGIYEVDIRVTTNQFNQPDGVNYVFTYDRLAPYYTNLKVNSTLLVANSRASEEEMLSKSTNRNSNTLLISEQINQISVNYHDLLSGINSAANLTSIALINPDGNLVHGVRSITPISANPDNYLCSWTLTNPIPADGTKDGVYTILLKATDIAGNILTQSKTFILQTEEPGITSYPLANANINQIQNNTVSVTFESNSPLIQNFANSYIRLINEANGDSLYNNFGANLTYNTTGNFYQINLALNNPLATDGSDDGNYKIRYRVKTVLGQVISGVIPFKYDTVKPVLTQLEINNSGLQSANSQYYFAENISSVSATLNDNLSGINFATNMSRVTLFNENNIVVEGNRSFNANTGKITWTLNQELNNDTNSGIYIVKIFSTDLAGNTLSEEISFRLINPQLPQITENIPANNAILRNLADNRISRRIIDTNGFGLDEELSYLKIINPFGTELTGNQSFNNLGNNRYMLNYDLNTALSNEGTADGLYIVKSLIVDVLGQVLAPDSTVFTYDSQAPLATNPLIGGNSDENEPWSLPLVDNSNYTQNISYAQINLSDLTTSVVFNSPNTYIRIFSSNNQPLLGTQTLSGNTLRWTLNDMILSDGSMDGAYFVRYSAIDLAGNIKEGRFDFRITNPFAPQITAISPNNGTVINTLINNRITVDFYDERPINLQDLTNSFIKLIAPDNSEITHNQGAIQSISNLGDNNYRMILNLNQNLTVNGLYSIQIQIQNTQEYNTYLVTQFVFDNQLPEIQNIVLGLTNGTEAIINNNDQIYNGINFVKVFLNDLTSGINYLSESTNLSVLINNMPATGTLTKFPNQGYIQLSFPQTINQTGVNINIIASAIDNAGNIASRTVQFMMESLNANIISISPASNSFINENLNEIKLVVEYSDQVNLNQNLSYLKLKHPDGTFIENGQGAAIAYTQINNRYEITLTLNQALSANGQDDGVYQISAMLVTDSFQEGPINFNFTYDRLNPYFENLKVNNHLISTGNPRSFGLNTERNAKNRSTLIIHEPIVSVEANYFDITSNINYASNLTNITLISPNGNLIQGSRIVTGNNVKWVLSSPIPANGTRDGVYTVELKATDYAGNTITYNDTFTLLSQIAPALVSFTPVNFFGFYVNQFTPPTITANFLNTVPVVGDISETYIKMVFPNGYVAEHNQGALLSYQLVQNEFRVTFQLTGPLSTNGENDGLFQVTFRAKNISGAVYEEVKTFIFDTTNPYFTDLNLVSNNNLIPLTNNQLIRNQVQAVQVKFVDLTAGIHYAPNISFISLLDRNDNLIPGTLTYIPEGQDFIVKWNLQNPIPMDGTADGVYKAKMMITDRAGNSTTQTVPFNIVSVLSPGNVMSFSDAVFNIHTSWTAPYNNSDISNYQIYRKYNENDFVFVGQTQQTHFSQSMLNQPDGNYQFKVRAVYNTPGNEVFYSDFVTGNIVTLHRFIPCTFNLTLSNNSEPSGVVLHLYGNDGLYNQEFNVVSEASGLIQLNSVFIESYILTLSKNGYHTIIDTIRIDTDNSSFDYTLEADMEIMNFIPENFALYQNFPNPFNPTTEIRFALKEKSSVDLSIFNIKGQRIQQLVDSNLSAGYHKSIWNGNDDYGRSVASGIYFYVISVKGENESYREVKKMMLIK